MFSVRPHLDRLDWGFHQKKAPPNGQEIAYGKHFINITIITFGAIFTSILLGVFMGPPVSTGGADLAMQVMAAVGVHVFIFFVAFNTEVLNAYATRLNPYVTLVDWLLDQSINAQLAFTELGAQALGATMASALFYAMVNSSPYAYVGATGIVNTQQGWAFFIEAVATALMAWTIFANRKHENRVRMALGIAYIVGVTAGFVYPFIGLTTHSPFRWLANCVPSGACGAPGFWIFFVAPLIGIPLGYFLHVATK